MAPYDLVLMDVQMPKMDGFAATKEIRKRERSLMKNKTNGKWHMTNDGSIATHVPIVAMTAHAMKGDREQCLESGMDDYITKPIDPQELLKKIERWIDIDKRAPSTEREAEQQSSRPSKGQSSPPIDLDKAMERAMGDRGVLEMMLQEFLIQVPAQIEALSTSPGARRCVDLREGGS